jgi:hypothetical protein
MNGKALTWLVVLGGFAWGLYAAPQHASQAVPLSDARTEWAMRHSSDELQFVTVSEGACSTCTLDVQLFPSDGSNCSYAEDVLLQNYDLVMQLMSAGFTTLACDAFDESGKIISTERRDISTGHHPAPRASTPTEPTPRGTPRQNEHGVSVA